MRPTTETGTIRMAIQIRRVAVAFAHLAEGTAA
jgi:hypothetical protein